MDLFEIVKDMEVAVFIGAPYRPYGSTAGQRSDDIYLSEHHQSEKTMGAGGRIMRCSVLEVPYTRYKQLNSRRYQPEQVGVLVKILEDTDLDFSTFVANEAQVLGPWAERVAQDEEGRRERAMLGAEARRHRAVMLRKMDALEDWARRNDCEFTRLYAPAEEGGRECDATVLLPMSIAVDLIERASGKPLGKEPV